MAQSPREARRDLGAVRQGTQRIGEAPERARLELGHARSRLLQQVLQLADMCLVHVAEVA